MYIAPAITNQLTGKGNRILQSTFRFVFTRFIHKDLVTIYWDIFIHLCWVIGARMDSKNLNLKLFEKVVCLDM